MKVYRHRSAFPGDYYDPSAYRSVVVDSEHPTNPRLHGRFYASLTRVYRRTRPPVVQSLTVGVGSVRLKVGRR